ncbi:MAG: metal-sulfur cluster assembly factor [Ignavibacteriales bacterium]
MGLGDMFSKVFKKENEKDKKSVAEVQKAEESLTQRESTDTGEKNNGSAQMAEPEQTDGVQENVEAGQEVKSEGSSPAVEPVTKEKILEVLSDVYDPEIPIDIVNLGLIYDVDIKEDGNVYVKMTMTAPGCPSSAQIAAESQMLIEGIRGVKEATIEIVWDPPWDPSRMSEDAKKGLGFM